ncbi:MAG: zinc ribbon domain-containing protein [Clostridiales bacterium]|nr:zinc ribbon domain-containing protein [Clostridiales bacterium]
MYCPECGTKNPDENKYCLNCSARLIDNSVASGAAPAFDIHRVKSDLGAVRGKARNALEKVDKEKASASFDNLTRNKKLLPALGVTAAVIALAVIFAAVGKSITSPKNIADKYFKSYISANYEKMYSCLDVTDSEFVNKNTFAVYMQNRSDSLTDVTNYELTELYGDSYYNDVAESADLKKTFNVTYYINGKSSGNYMNIVLIKSSDKKLFFFDDYKVTLENLVVNNVKILTPAGAEITLDGVKIDKKYREKASEETSWCDVYTVSAMFGGEHAFLVSGSVYKDSEVTEYVAGGSEITLTAELSNAAVLTLKTRSESVIKAFYTGASIKKPFGELGIVDGTGEIEEKYNELTDQFSEKNVIEGVVTKTEFDSVYADNAGNYSADADIEYTYNYSQTGYDGIKKVNTDTGFANVVVTFSFDADTSEFTLIKVDI